MAKRIIPPFNPARALRRGDALMDVETNVALTKNGRLVKLTPREAQVFGAGYTPEGEVRSERSTANHINTYLSSREISHDNVTQIRRRLKIKLERES